MDSLEKYMNGVLAAPTNKRKIGALSAENMEDAQKMVSRTNTEFSDFLIMMGRVPKIIEKQNGEILFTLSFPNPIQAREKEKAEREQMISYKQPIAWQNNMPLYRKELNLAAEKLDEDTNNIIAQCDYDFWYSQIYPRG